MKVTVRDSEILKTIEPNVLESHLRAFGWHEQGRIYNNAGAIWRLKNGSLDDEFEILLPLKTSLGDYAARISDAISTLEVVEKRSQLDILSELLTKASNIEIQGIVTEIQESNSMGAVTLMGVVVGKLRKIKAELKQPEYTLAIKAYQERLPVICTGDLSKEDSFFLLHHLHHFGLLFNP
jgi:predicted CopG family antitoxin